ncbi:hypothetical protein J2X31_001245 [Flavobacterium arsenatis]|uniref:Lipoprotein n=1 Tax=Flavobacterium arsenatis TaxID=1484332 RepID=A0ABU1TP58_9FLAO|nr:hypothetical protein [Flavobacterium arsenatis]MDR6967238.1 hypothetical protein [Flavobacterium arsenatis]
MKRFFSFLVLAVLFTGCDDGDMQEVSFEFNESAAGSCNSNASSFFIYKTTDQRALILKLAERNFTNTVTSDSLAQQGGAISLDIDTNNQLIYRVYNDNITPTTMCPPNGVPAAYPVVTEERRAINGGKMFIRTTPIRSEENANGSTTITEYLHTISFSDITFITADGVQRNESLPPVTYRTPASSFNFTNLSSVQICAENNHTLLFRYLNDKAMTLRLSEADAAFLFSNDISAPKVRYLNSENILNYRFFSRTDITPLTNNYFCSVTQPDLPSVRYIWTGNSSVDQNTGVIEVVTEQTDDNLFKHTITLKNVTMARASQNFKLERDFIFGEVETTTVP